MSGAEVSGGGGFFRDRAAASNARRDARGYEIRRELHASCASTASPRGNSPPLHLARRSGTFPTEVPHTFSINGGAGTSRPEAATTSLREHHTLHIEEVRR
ncbi:hypothetical protein ACIPN8_02105 [Streptomyces sp. NPDC086082]|uniref:hypothetical protein n=1 Tax=Streptomyces sp. NPDC086082 TaxID=3365750 RepID=UPI00381E80A8